jgi:tetratricopeptide (TPR) repeat protein
MKQTRPFLSLLLLVAWSSAGQAGIYISTEKLEPNADLKAFASQLKFLRAYGPTDVSLGGTATKQREDFLAKVKALRDKGKLTPDEQANLGGYLLYLKQTAPRQPIFEEAVAVLEAAYRTTPQNFALAANLGTAYHLTGRLDAAARCLEGAVDLADDKQRPFVRLHLRLVQQRLRESFGRGRSPDLDPLFGRPTDLFRFVDENGQWNYGRLARREIEKLPGQSVEEAVRQVQMLLLWLPDDGRLTWQLAEWALVLGNKSLALELFNNSVDTFRLSHPTLKQHRLLLQEAFHWGTFAERVSRDERPEQWLVRTLGQSFSSLLSPDGLGGELIVAGNCGAKQDNLSAVWGDDVSDGEPAGTPFVMQTWHWVLICVGVVVALLMLVWQVQQFVRPRRA